MTRTHTFVGILASAAMAFGQGHSASIAPSKMTLAPGFQAQLVASEPDVRQPVAIDFDERGRLWVMQYLQYPNPAGLKRVKVDRYSRTAYDRVPEPPPRGPKGADRLTILEDDPANPGKLKAKDFVTGLNLASGFAFGHGGVFVLQVPYLLFYPDRNGDDIPDGDPDVLLTGFGMEDAHSVANSLTWGPDGWLYGCQGSTVTANIRGIEFQQGVWRYHPLTRKFELFCEGGGNSWGLDFDKHGHLLYSTNHGGFTMLHGVQGGYYWKSFGKHGALHNPHAYGYFDHVPHDNFHGGHVTVGGFLYRGDQFPASFRDKYINGDLLGHAVRWQEVFPHGSSFRSRNGGELVVANDTWFASSDVCLGPDGCVYVADWHDVRTAHPDPDAEWDRTNGRVYRISYGKAPAVPKMNLAKEPTDKLIRLLSHSNEWYARTARRILADRRDPEAIFPLRTAIRESKDENTVLQSLWALHASGGIDANIGLELLSHGNEHVRRWAVRLLVDEGLVSEAVGKRLQEMAGRDRSLTVLSQLACSARRLPADVAIPLIRSMCDARATASDPHLPLLLWWGVERFAVSNRQAVLEAFTRVADSQVPVIRDTILPRLARRYAVEGTQAGDVACGAVVVVSPSASVLAGFEQGLRDRTGPPPSEYLLEIVRAMDRSSRVDRLLVRAGDRSAVPRVLEAAGATTNPLTERIAAIEVLADVDSPDVKARLMRLVMGGDVEAVRLAALGTLQRGLSDAQVRWLIGEYPKLPPAIRGRVRTALLARSSSARELLEAVEAKTIDAKEFTPDELFAVSAHNNPKLNDLVRKHWGAVRSATPEEKLADVRRFNNDLRAAKGDVVAGKALFTKHCAACHKLHGEGGAVGPDLTHANRADRDYLLVSLVDPSSVVRKEYVSHVAELADGRLLTGLITAQSDTTITLTNAKAEATVIRRADISSLRESAVSLMPEGLLQALRPKELRDLFAFLQGTK